MSLNHLKIKREDFLLELYKEMNDGTLGRLKGSDHTLE